MKAPLAFSISVVGLALGNLIELVAQFMPMKSVFLIAGGKVPSFFPQFLIDAGPVPTSGVLLLSAGGVAIMGHGIKNAFKDRQKTGFYVPPRISSLHQKLWVDVELISTLLLAGTLFVAGGLISLHMVLLALLWVVAAALVLFIRTHYRPRKAPFVSGHAEFVSNYRKVQNVAAIWVVVAAAIYALSQTTPRLGVTGVLLVAIFMRKFIVLTSEIVPAILDWERLSKRRAPEPLSIAAKSVFLHDFLLSDSGFRQLSQALRSKGFSFDRLVGLPDKLQASLLIQSKNSANTRLLRLFVGDNRAAPKEEIASRQRFSRMGLVPEAETTFFEVASLRGVVFRFDSTFQPVGARGGGESLEQIRLNWDRRFIASSEFQNWAQGFELLNPLTRLRDRLIQLERAGLIETWQLAGILDQWAFAESCFRELPRTLGLGRPWVPDDVLVAEDECVLINFREARVEHFAYSWGNLDKIFSAPAEEGARDSVFELGTNSIAARVVAHSGLLEREIDSRHTGRAVLAFEKFARVLESSCSS